MIQRRTLLAASAATALAGSRARAQGASLKIGVLGDQSGVYRDLSGPVAVACVRQAIEEMSPHLNGVDVEVVTGDHQNKPDVGASIARQWFDRDGVDVIVDVPEQRRGAGGGRGVPGEGQGLHQQPGHDRRPHRAAMRADHGALDHGHLGAGALDRRRRW